MNNIKYSYYVSSGDQNKMHTLRVAYSVPHMTPGGGTYVSEHDQYVRNLSTDYDKARAKAELYLEERGLLDCLVEQKPFCLQEIRRRTAEEIEAANAEAARLLAIAQEEAEERFLSRIASQYELIDNNQWPFGQYREKPFFEAPDNYIMFMANLEPDTDARPESQALMRTLQTKLKEQYPKMFNLPTSNGEHFGNPKQRITIEATLTSLKLFDSSNYYSMNEIGYCAEFIDSDGFLFVYIGLTRKAFSGAGIGDKVRFQASIKEHTEYNGVKQTKIQRLTTVK